MSSFPVKRVFFENYRAFKARQTIELKPITLLFGYNNSGKSAALRFLPLLASSFDAVRQPTYTKSHLNYTASCMRGATFNDITFGNENKLGLGIEWDDGTSVECEIRQDGADPEIFSHLQITFPNQEGTLHQRKFVQSISSDRTNEEVYESTDDPHFLVNVDGFSISPQRAADVKSYDFLRQQQRKFSRSVHWLASIRVHPPREFDIGAGIEIGIKHNGEGTAQTLWYLAESGHKAFEQINEWLENTCGRKIDISTATMTAKPNGRRTVKLETVATTEEALRSGAIRIPILDSGEGIAQALPVVTLCAQAAHGDLGEFPIVVIEQPELHLHPKAIIDLANFLIVCIKQNKNVRFVIETHSESLLLAFQTAIVDQNAEPNEVGCYWVHPDAKHGGNALTPIAIDEEGFISENWPEEVFEETLHQARQLIAKREAKVAKGSKKG